jgi:hypothetical protein
MDVQTATVVIAGISVVIAAVNSIYSSRRAEEQRALTLKTQQQALETRQAALFMQVYNRWSSVDVTKGYGFLRYQHPDITGQALYDLTVNPYDEAKFAAVHSLYQYFEGLAVLVEEGLIDIDLVTNLFSRRIIWFWERTEALSRFIRQHLKDPTQYDSLERLYFILKQREQEISIKT